MPLEQKKEADFVLHNLDSLLIYPNSYKNKNSQVSWETVEEHNYSVASKDGVICWIGSSSELSDNVKILPECNFYNGNGLLAVPGFVDSHTHLVYAGNRSDEFEMRVQGRDYLDILAAGGGILKTTTAIRALSEEALYSITAERLEKAMETGITTIEIKSGYGLNLKNELKMLNVVKQLNEDYPIHIIPTFMGAHAIPSDKRADPDAFVDEICNEWIPEISQQGLAVFNDVFCEKSAFSVEQAKKVLEAGLQHGLKPKIHADEVNVLGALDLAIDLNAISADHLLMTEEEGIKKLVGSGVIPTVLPGTSTYLMESHHAPAKKMIEAGLPLAIASDHNPGSSQFLGANIIQSLAMLQLRMNASEAIIAGTLHAAHALDMGNEIGSIEVGKKMDIALLKCYSFKEIGYAIGQNHVIDIIVEGESVFR